MQIFDGDALVLDIQVDDESYRYRSIMGENSLTLKFSLAEHVEIPLGSYCEFMGETYTLDIPENLKMNHSRSFDYTVTMSSSQAHLVRYKFRNTIDRRLKFSLTAKPQEHLQMLIDNLNLRETGWIAGECIEGTEKLISYNHTTCMDALSQIAEAFETEWEVTGKTISLKKVEYNKDNPLALAYGKGKGFRPGIGRTNYEDSQPVEVLFVQGGERNIDASKYGNAELLLPKNSTLRFDGNKFEYEDGFDGTKARTYVTDADGYSIRRQDKELQTHNEDSLDCSEIYPSRDETIIGVIVSDAEKNWYDVVTDAPESLDYSQYGIGGETPTIIFQTGELAGREFDLESDDNGIICEKVYSEEGAFKGWKFQIVPSEQDGITMPGGSFVPVVGDKLRIFGIQLPDAYICDNDTKSGASWEMFRQGVKYLYGNEDAKFTFTGELDGIWAKKDWINIGGKIRLGGFISFTNEQFQPEPVLIRITGIKDYINNPYSPEIELSNSTSGNSVRSELNKIASNEVTVDDKFRESVNFTKRRFRDTKETIAMLEDAMLEGFTDSISPLTVQTMMMLVGDQSLQFRFVDGTSDPHQVVHVVEYDADTKILKIDEGIIQHMTLGINSVSEEHSASEYKFWTLPEYTTPVLDNPAKKYYVYAKVGRTSETGIFYLSETAKGMESEAGSYYLLMGILNSEYAGERSYVSLYGYTEILPGQITTDVIRDSEGRLVIDLPNAVITAKDGARINGNITIGPGSSGLSNLEEWTDAEQSIQDAQNTANEALGTANEAKDYIDNTLPSEIAEINNRLDGVVENWFYKYAPSRQNEPAATWIADGEEADHAGDTFTNIQEYVDDETTPDAGKSWRWALIDGQYDWTPIADSDAVKALQEAARAQDTADQKRRVFVTTPYTPYDVGDIWTQGPDGEIMRCIKVRATGSYAASDWDKASKYTDDTVADEANDRLDNIEYLKSLFPNSTLVAGATISQMAVVTDKNPDDGGKVIAGLNGTDNGKDSTHGKVLLFAGSDGIDETGEKISNAETKIYEDGHIKANSVDIEGNIVATNGSIGNFEITEESGGLWLKANGGDGDYGMSMSAARIAYFNNVIDDYITNFIVQSYPGGRYLPHAELSVKSEFTGQAPSAYNGILNIGIALNVFGATYKTLGNDIYGNFAVRSDAGMFAGLRPALRIVTDASLTLTKYDFTLFANNQRENTYMMCNLPTNPENGQTYMIFKEGQGDVRIATTDGKMIHRLGYGDSTATGFGNAQGIAFVAYSAQDGKWWCSFMRWD